ncbi:MAG: nitroreductase family protein, partial [Desulfobacterales bacterium]|nr:nitroreductase family protein [Desulfobacterales bacterium]
MENIIIDQSKCVKCKKCIKVCSSNVLSFDTERVIISYPEFCISCGHCAAICLKDAISSHPDNNRNPFVTKLIPSDRSDNQLLFHEKRSVREFKDQPIPKDLIEELIKYGEKAPSSENLRKRKYYVITDKNKIAELEQAIAKIYKNLLLILNPLLLKLVSLWSKKTANELKNLVIDFKRVVDEQKKGMNPIFRDAPSIICTAAPTNSVQSKDDCLATQQYMMLYG